MKKNKNRIEEVLKGNNSKKVGHVIFRYLFFGRTWLAALLLCLCGSS